MLWSIAVLRAADVLREYQLDYDSMSEWRERMEKGLDLAKASNTSIPRRVMPFLIMVLAPFVLSNFVKHAR